MGSLAHPTILFALRSLFYCTMTIDLLIVCCWNGSIGCDSLTIGSRACRASLFSSCFCATLQTVYLEGQPFSWLAIL